MNKSDQAFLEQEERFWDLVHNERLRQDELWGEQNHNVFIWASILGEEKGEVDKACLEAYFGNKIQQDIEKEIIEVAAVAKAMWESLQRNGFKKLCV